MNRASKLVAYILFALLLTLTPWLIVELYAAGTMWWIISHNPYILSSRGLRSYPAEIDLPIPDTQPCGSVSAETVNWFDGGPPRKTTAVPSGALWEVPRRAEDESAREARRRIFPQLNQEDRDYFATIYNEIICEFDQNGRIVNRYGNWLREGQNNITNWLITARKSASTHYAELHVVGGIFDLPIKIFYLSPGDSKSMYGFLNLEELLVKNSARTLSPDSPWEIPFYRYKKNLTNTYTGMGTHCVSTNNYGYRGADIHLPKPAGVFRIVCIGGSTTEEGQEGATYPKLVEDKLRADFPNKQIEVINCGISGMTTTRHLLKFAEYLEFQPDVIVIYEGVNDICHDLLVYWESNANIIGKALQRSPFFKYRMNRWLFPSDESIVRDINDLTVRNIDAMRRAAVKNGVRVVVCGLPCPDIATASNQEREFLDYGMRSFCTTGYMSADVYMSMVHLYQSELKELCTRRNILYIPLEDCLSGGLYYFTDICHLWPRGIERKATIIAAFLKDYIRPAMNGLNSVPTQ